MGMPGPQKINRYGIAFKLKAVQMSNQPDVLIKDVAESLCIHPFMLSRWRKEVRDGELVGKPPPIDSASVAELQRLREVGQQLHCLQMKHDLLKKAIRFASDRKQNLCVHRGNPAQVRDPNEVRSLRCYPRRFLRLAVSPAQCAYEPRRTAHRADTANSPAKPGLLRQSAGHESVAARRDRHRSTSGGP